MSMLPDLLAPGLDIVFCGTAAGERSAQLRAYYAGQGNAFWPTLYTVGLTPRIFKPEEYQELLALGLGLTDLVKTVAGVDRVLSAHHYDTDGLRERIRAYHPRMLAFTSKNAAQVFFGKKVGYGLTSEAVGNTRFFVLPSTSGLARKHWSEAPWQELAALRSRGWQYT